MLPAFLPGSAVRITRCSSWYQTRMILGLEQPSAGLGLMIPCYSVVGVRQGNVYEAEECLVTAVVVGLEG